MKEQLPEIFKSGRIASAENAEQLETIFETLRDDRFIYDREQDLPRRLTWFYPDDGCYMRAESVVRYLKDQKKPVPAKIFAFGSLRVTTPHSPKGYVKWWYHVAPVISLNEELYVLDPALASKEPLPVQRWLEIMSDQPETLKVSFCESHTYSPGRFCVTTRTAQVTPISQKTLETRQASFLTREWNRVIQLGMDPLVVFGEEFPFEIPDPEGEEIPVPSDEGGNG